MNNGNVGQYGPDGKFNFVDFSKVTSTADATRDRKPAEPTPEQKLVEAIQKYNWYTKDSRQGLVGGTMGLMRDMMFPGGNTDPTELGLRKEVSDAYNEYTAWKNNQGAETPTTTDTNTTVKDDAEKKPDFFETSGITKKIPEDEEKKETATTADTVEYTYKPGDTFGQVVKNLGLESGSGLWGDNGDVAYYTQQLMEQGALNDRGNIPIGTTIRLTRRPVDPALQEYYKKYGYRG